MLNLLPLERPARADGRLGRMAASTLTLSALAAMELPNAYFEVRRGLISIRDTVTRAQRIN